MALFDSLNVVLYSQIVNNLDSNNSEESEAMLSLSTCMILLLVNYFIYCEILNI